MKKELRIDPLSPDRLDDFLAFFESIRFTENPHWSECYCYSFHFTGTSAEWNRENNKSSASRLIKEGNMKGYLAYDDGKPVGWCNVNNRLNYNRLMKLYDLPEPGNNKICSIVCFLIHPDHRRRGIARLMLDRIEEDYTSLGYDIIEAYPGKGDLSCEGQFKGPLELYQSNSFKIEREYEDYFLVRKHLK